VKNLLEIVNPKGAKVAETVYDQMIQVGLTRAENISHEGVGEGIPLYDNSLPEGRALNRTVTVSIL
jgi:outer membrane protein OmpA-like peptidoglycan-associated protein